MGLLDGDIADAIAGGFDGLLLTGTLQKTTVTGRDSYGDPIYTTATSAVQGFLDTYSAIMIAAAGIPATDVRVILIAGLCDAVPAISDKVTLGGTTYQIRNIARDPANATYDMQCFKAPAS
jgi:hypothetical protein